MKQSVQISVHVIFWVLFTAVAIMLSKLYLEAKPDALFAPHFTYVITLEVIMGLIFFYSTFFGLPWARKRSVNTAILVAVLLALTLFFAFPAMKFGMLQVLSSVIPHVFLIFLAIVFRRFSDL
jgi:hypothetical protein